MITAENAPERLILIAFFLLIAFPVHEFAHAYSAYRLGDATAKMFGRLTLNPLAHFDQVGGTMLVISILLTGFPFGFAQTPVNPSNLRGRYGYAIVSVAGPLANLLTAAIVAIPLRVLISANPELLFTAPLLFTVLSLVVYLSILNGLFNLIPIPPLDGGAILLSLLPPRTTWQLRPFLNRYGLFILILLILPIFGNSSILARVLFPIGNAIYGFLVG